MLEQRYAIILTALFPDFVLMILLLTFDIVGEIFICGKETNGALQVLP